MRPCGLDVHKRPVPGVSSSIAEAAGEPQAPTLCALLFALLQMVQTGDGAVVMGVRDAHPGRNGSKLKQANDSVR